MKFLIFDNIAFAFKKLDVDSNHCKRSTTKSFLLLNQRIDTNLS
jgi:hypothetical protein